MSGYKKILKDDFEKEFYKALGFPPLSDDYENELVIRITLDDMNLIDGFYMKIPISAEFLSIEQMLNEYVLCDTTEKKSNLKAKLSNYENPDLVDFIDVLDSIYARHKLGRLIIHYHINNGESNIRPEEPLYLYEQVYSEKDKIYKLVDLVLEVQDNPFYLITRKEKKSLISEFRLIFVLYLIDKYNDLSNINSLKPKNKKRMYRIINKLLSENLINVPDDDLQNISISYKGRELVDRLIDEAEYYIENYDIFGDVYVKGIDDILFNSGYGDNIIPTVMLNDGINPYRAIFLSALYIGNLDEIASDLNRLFSDGIFDSLFEFFCYSPTKEELGSEVFSKILDKGKEKVFEDRLLLEKAMFIEKINSQIDQM